MSVPVAQHHCWLCSKEGEAYEPFAVIDGERIPFLALVDACPAHAPASDRTIGYRIAPAEHAS